MTQVQDILGGRYQLLDILGRGGMGVVYRATDQVLGRAVAVKILPLDRASDPTFVTRFEREAMAAAALNHPNIVAIYDTGRDEETRFIVMECVPGKNAGQLLSERGRFHPPQAVRVGAQVASALGAAHRAGIIHRDIKPANVMVAEDGRVKVLDFGIARAAAYTTLTQTDVILGSAPYLAPEVTSGRPADERSDIYALGCVIYATLTGDPPFTGEPPAAIMQRHIASEPRSPRELQPGIPVALEAMVMSMLAKDPDLRPQSAAELASALPAVLEPGETATLPLARVPPSARMAPVPPALGDVRSHSRLPLAAALLTAACVLAIVLLAGSGFGSHHTAASTGRHRPARAKPAAARRHMQPAPAHRVIQAPMTVGAAADALAAVVSQDLQQGTVDRPAAEQVFGPLRAATREFSDGNASDALVTVGALPAQIAQLAAHGDIQDPALAGLDGAVAQLQAALERSAPQSSSGDQSAPSPADGPPGHPGDHGPKGPKGPKDGRPGKGGGDGGD